MLQCIGIGGGSYSGKDTIAETLARHLNNRVNARHFLYIPGGSFFRAVAKYTTDNVLAPVDVEGLQVRYLPEPKIISVNGECYTQDFLDQEYVARLSSKLASVNGVPKIIDSMILSEVERLCADSVPVIAGRSIDEFLRRSSDLFVSSLRVYLDLSQEGLSRRVGKPEAISAKSRDSENICVGRLWYPDPVERYSPEEFVSQGVRLSEGVVCVDTSDLSVEGVIQVLYNVVTDIGF